jgi:hypothetical protein
MAENATTQAATEKQQLAAEAPATGTQDVEVPKEGKSTEDKVGEKRKAEAGIAPEAEKKYAHQDDPQLGQLVLTSYRTKTDEVEPAADKGKGKGKSEALPEPEPTVDEDDEDPEDLIITRPRRRNKVDYSSVSPRWKSARQC